MYVAVTNNPRLRVNADSCVFVDGPAAAVFVKARDLIHVGYRLLVHPLAGNLEPARLWYKTLALAGPEPGTDRRSLELIETALAAAENGRSGGGPALSVRQELQMLDAELAAAALPELFYMEADRAT